MLSVMSANGDDGVQDFLTTGRVGRRNAVPNIMSDPNLHTSTADLPDRLRKMTTETEEGEGEESTSGTKEEMGRSEDKETGKDEASGGSATTSS